MRHDIDPKQVYVLPSGQYASYIPERSQGELEPSVQVAQWIERIGEWHPTPARHYASTLLGLDEYSGHPGKPVTGRLSIDYGQGWGLDEADTAAHVAFAAGVHRYANGQTVPGTFTRATNEYRARF